MQPEGITGEPEPDLDAERRLAWLRAARRPHAWAGLLEELASALGAVGFDRHLASDIWRQAGAKWAAAHELPPCGTLEEAEAAMNRQLADAVLGYVALAPSDRTIGILHSEAPPDTAGEVMSWLLEGLYTAWMHGLGANPSLVARLKPGGPPDLLTFHFGQAEANS